MIQFLEQVIRDLKEADEKEQVPYTVGENERIYGLEHKNKAELYELAVERDIPNRSKMSKEELLNAIANTLNGQEKESIKQPTEKLKDKSKEELYYFAQERSIKGRSQMKEKELVSALNEKQTEKLK